MDQQRLEEIREDLSSPDLSSITKGVGTAAMAARFMRRHPWTMVLGGGALLGLGTYFSRKDKKQKKAIKEQVKVAGKNEKTDEKKDEKKGKKAKKKGKELEA